MSHQRKVVGQDWNPKDCPLQRLKLQSHLSAPGHRSSGIEQDLLWLGPLLIKHNFAQTGLLGLYS